MSKVTTTARGREHRQTDVCGHDHADGATEEFGPQQKAGDDFAKGKSRKHHVDAARAKDRE